MPRRGMTSRPDSTSYILTIRGPKPQRPSLNFRWVKGAFIAIRSLTWCSGRRPTLGWGGSPTGMASRPTPARLSLRTRCSNIERPPLNFGGASFRVVRPGKAPQFRRASRPLPLEPGPNALLTSMNRISAPHRPDLNRCTLHVWRFDIKQGRPHRHGRRSSAPGCRTARSVARWQYGRKEVV